MVLRSSPPRRALRPLVFLLAASLSPAAMAAEPPAASPSTATTAGAATQSTTVGQARVVWHLQPTEQAQRPALVEAFRKATEAHLTGGEPFVTPKRHPVTLPGGQLKLALPAELIQTMFVDADGRQYCSDSTVTARRPWVSQTAGDGR